jgi:hypothetical protein
MKFSAVFEPTISLAVHYMELLHALITWLNSDLEASTMITPIYGGVIVNLNRISSALCTKRC